MHIPLNLLQKAKGSMESEHKCAYFFALSLFCINFVDHKQVCKKGDKPRQDKKQDFSKLPLSSNIFFNSITSKQLQTIWITSRRLLPNDCSTSRPSSCIPTIPSHGHQGGILPSIVTTARHCPSPICAALSSKGSPMLFSTIFPKQRPLPE